MRERGGVFAGHYGIINQASWIWYDLYVSIWLHEWKGQGTWRNFVHEVTVPAQLMSPVLVKMHLVLWMTLHTSGLVLPTWETLSIVWTIMQRTTLLWIKNGVMWLSVMLKIKQDKSCVCGTAFGYLSGATDIDITTLLIHLTADLGYHWVWISLPRISHLPIVWTTLLCMCCIAISLISTVKN